ncbi:MAG: DUF6262 family protein [Lachnotalea sp.]
MNDSNKRNTTGIEKFREEKKSRCNNRVESAIYEMVAEHAEINFNSLSKRASVSKRYLYNNHFDTIDSLRQMKKNKTIKSRVTDNGKDILLAAKNKRIKELEAEVTRLKDILKRKYGQTYYEND